MNLFKVIYNSFIVGLLLSVLAFQNEWIEMRVNVGLIVPIFMALSLVIYGIVRKNKNIMTKVNLKVTTINLFILIVTSIMMLGFKPSIILISAMLREAIGYVNIGLEKIAIILVSFLVVGFSILFRYEKTSLLAKEKGELKIAKYKKINSN